jgi:uncharacterized membrane protein
MQQTTVTGRERAVGLAANRGLVWVSRHWLALFIVIYGAWVLTPFLAPWLMAMGAARPAQAIYFFYSFFCHQLPERSLFFFGQQPMYSLAEIRAVWPLDGFAGLRQFIGNPAMGYKMAWSDRMISFYGGLWAGALLFAIVRTRLKSLSPVLWLLFGIAPVGLDGFTHMLNDVLVGVSGTGFRDTNAWLQALTGNVFPQSFYVGDALGSFNSDMRWVTGLLFGLTTVWFLFPLVEKAMKMVVSSRSVVARG